MVLLAFVLTSLFGYSQYQPTSNGQVVEHTYYSLSYIEKHEQAEWVYYKLTPEMINGDATRKDNFRADPNIKKGSASLLDYKGSDYDRGHLAPAADFKYNEVAMSETFYMSNMSPQKPSFNRGGWKNLEALIRKWCLEENELYIVTGVIFKDKIDKIGINDVTVPSSYYKIVYNPTDEKMIAFVMPNNKIYSPLKSFVYSVDYVESVTGIDFFHQLPNDLEKQIENGNNADEWFLQDISNRCSAITSSGTRCKRDASDGSEYCWQHQEE